MAIDTEQMQFDLADRQSLTIHRQAVAGPIADVAGAVRDALEHPLDYPALRRALTPDDHVAIVVDEQLADLPRLVTPLVEHIAAAHVTPDAMTFLCAEGSSAHAWARELPPDFRNIKVEEHDPHNRKRLSYLATTKQGRRVYLNRTAVDADQLVVLSRRWYDPLLGHGGAEGAIFPALSDAETHKALLPRLSMEPADAGIWPIRQEAEEIVWLLGAPFFVQVIEGAGEKINHIVAGPIAASAEGQRMLDGRWRVEMDAPAATVIAKLSGQPHRHTFADVARALACASRVVQPGGRIIVLSGGNPEPDDGGQRLRQADTPEEALTLLKDYHALDRAAAFQWAQAARRADLYLLSNLPAELAEEMFATPLDNVRQVQRLVGDAPYLYLPDADRTLAVIRL
jgi:nickel-dependent lactate racemase